MITAPNPVATSVVEGPFPLLVAVVATLAAGLLLSVSAARLGLVDEGGGHGLHRAWSGAPKRLVGGLALATGVAASVLAAGPELRPGAWRLSALFLALAGGWLDDRSESGLAARSKLALQALAALAFALGGQDGGPTAMALAFAAAIAAQNVANTYDHADGLLLSSAAAALLLARPEWGLAALAVLAFNLRWKRPASVLLGDAGSHLLALMLLCEPRAWGAFLIPALDLARVVLVRRRQGRAWWIGDRAHLAHRLQARGLGPGAVAALTLAAALPAILAVALAEGALYRGLGLAASAAAFALLVRSTSAVDGRGVRVPSSRSEPSSASAGRAP